jgi:hypothetical protein
MKVHSPVCFPCLAAVITEGLLPSCEFRRNPCFHGGIRGSHNPDELEIYEIGFEECGQKSRQWQVNWTYNLTNIKFKVAMFQ